MQGRRGTDVVELCFHGIGRPERELEPGEDRYWISRDFYTQLLDLVAGVPHVRLSFDDGNASDVAIGLPGLQERELRATFYVLAGRLDRPGSLTTAEVAELSAAGMTVGSHGMDHRPWRGLADGEVERELGAARQIIEAAAGARVEDAALPLGRYDRRTLAHLRKRGYTSVATSDRRHVRQDAWLHHRFSVGAEDSIESVRRMLSRQPVARRLERSAVGAVKRMR